MFDINKFIHIGRIAQGKDVDEYLAVIYSVVAAFIQNNLLFFYINPVTFSIVDNLLEKIFSVL